MITKAEATRRAIALADAVQGNVSHGLTRGQVDTLIRLARDTSGTNPEVRRATDMAGVIMPGYLTALNAYIDNPQCAEAYRQAHAVRTAVLAHDAAHSEDNDAALRQRRELAQAIAQQATALAEGRVVGPEHAAVARLASNVQLLAAWTLDDRS